MKIPIEVSARHIHLNQKTFQKLFSKSQLTKLRDISQPRQFAANETVDVENDGKQITNVRIVGPFRDDNQLEISKTDAYVLGFNPPIRISGDIQNTPGVLIKGSQDEVKLDKGVIIAKRHLHISPEDADKISLKHEQIISIRISSKRELIFNEVTVRSRSKIDKLAFHLDTDEANAADVKNGDFGEII
ncbi:hypothetical protein A3F08_02185 [Candidatus Berkelbacteria bacterium RIFCSPHIGHO2_12_FULL_36_9]|uniref:Phosphate propanoyltransferase n=1 Tax=Candidatus Berkelbacteria bacterium RIFCSPHIGHO2_12_FULL_36_9 TaxID=1797469 RepID=A0A1F5EFU9_9BACT|nr:MAG: hypothetical protein A3F08_02185 [Candidatus Berkelbacteria bacterium RIFCSPHIGHO2_12_FULL_36_9]